MANAFQMWRNCGDRFVLFNNLAGSSPEKAALFAFFTAGRPHRAC
jgi:hypothetical protein